MNRQYYGWLAGATLSSYGDSVLFFALGWAATGIGPQVAGLVLTGFTVPRAVLLLVGGVIGDRLGVKRVLLGCYAVAAAATLCLALALHLSGPSAALLMCTALLLGTADAFALPAVGSFPRLLVPDDELPRALALRTSTNQVVSLVGGPTAGLLVATAGVVGVLLVDAVTFVAAFLVLVAVRPVYPVRASDGRSVLREAFEGIRLAWGSPVLRLLLTTVAGVAAFVLPATSLCLPLLARAHAWTAAQTGLVVGAAVVGGLAVTLTVARRGAARRPLRTAAVGCLLTATALLALSFTSTPLAALPCVLLQGVGVALFTAHVAPLFATAVPRTHLTRLHSLLALAQTVPLLVSTNALATLPPARSFQVAGGVMAITSVALAWRSRR